MQSLLFGSWVKYIFLDSWRQLYFQDSTWEGQILAQDNSWLYCLEMSLSNSYIYSFSKYLLNIFMCQSPVIQWWAKNYIISLLKELALYSNGLDINQIIIQISGTLKLCLGAKLLGKALLRNGDWEETRRNHEVWLGEERGKEFLNQWQFHVQSPCNKSNQGVIWMNLTAGRSWPKRWAGAKLMQGLVDMLRFWYLSSRQQKAIEVVWQGKKW